ncbi:MAG: ABC transporter ATP-binding protein [Acidobacteria bacterium]|nr:ABC transporter ATP-binding protein [Acidobacteriota bacterium]
MNEPIIQVEGIDKKYRIAAAHTHYRTLRETLTSAAARGLNRFRNVLKGQAASTGSETFWALRDVSFSVHRGQVLGLIGQNGAGKSTLLKIIARITEPTAGRVTIRGRLSSMLEVGTGFHPELTGRENIFLNGAILGMTRAEIERKFDEIVAFSEIADFLETPVKHYSSGMYVRLAFAVAAHLEPQILLIDEVLAVGDVEFQRKCLRKMGSVAREGRTIIFVSHQMNAVRELCDECLLLDKGRIVRLGVTNDVIKEYLGRTATTTEWRPSHEERFSHPNFTPTRLQVVDTELDPIRREVQSGERFGVVLEGEVSRLSPNLSLGIAVYASGNELLFWSWHTDQAEGDWPRLREGPNRLVVWIPAHFLNEEIYRIHLIASIHPHEWILHPRQWTPQVYIKVTGRPGRVPHRAVSRPGFTAPVLDFDELPPLTE